MKLEELTKLGISEDIAKQVVSLSEQELAAEKSKLTDKVAELTAEYTTKGKSDTSTKSDSQNVERIILENHIRAELDVDGEKVAEKVIEKTETINRRKGK